MPRHDEHERRVYQLATLLSGQPRLAVSVTEAVIDAQPRLEELDLAHLDRMTVLRSREVQAATLVDQRLPMKVARALAQLPDQQREAWVLARVYRMPWRQVARAMDCSTTATSRHLEQSDLAMQQALGEEVEDAAQRLLAFAQSLEVPDLYHVRRRRKRVIRIATVVSLAVVAIAVCALFLMLIWRMTES